jgi:predicted porin
MKSFATAAVAAALASAAVSGWAQSSVTVFGFIELQAGRQTQQAPGTKMFDMAGSRLGFKGDEDLGGGTKASFYLEHRFNPNDGSSSSDTTFWKGGSWVGLSNDASWGAVKLGRWWSQAFLKAQYAADPFGMGTLGEGAYGSVGCGPAFRGGCLGAFWVNNSVTYEKSFGPVAFGAQYAAQSVDPGGKHPWNVGVSYTDGPLYLGAGHEASNDGSSSERWSSFAANYDFGAAKLYGGYGTGRDAASVSRKNLLAGFSVPLGASEIIASYDVQDQAGVRVEQLLSLGYKYHLSKNTNVFAVLANDSKAPAGTNKTGYALGVFHAF